STDDKSKIPKLHAMIYPAMIPNNIGMILRKPRNVTQNTIVIINVNAATLASVTLMDQSAGASASGIQPAISAAVGTSSNPITAIIAPMAAGGKMTSIQLVPTRRINSPISVLTQFRQREIRLKHSRKPLLHDGDSSQQGLAK